MYSSQSTDAIGLYANHQAGVNTDAAPAGGPLTVGESFYIIILNIMHNIEDRAERSKCHARIGQEAA